MNTQNSELVRILTTISNTVQQFVDIVTPYLEPVARGLVAMSEWHQITKVLNSAGWLPHYTTPLSLVADCSGDVLRRSQETQRILRAKLVHRT